MTEKDAARFLALNPRTLRKWRNSARGPSFVRVESRIRYSLRALQEYLAERTVMRMPNTRSAGRFYRRTRVEELGEKHPGLRDFVEERQRRRVPNRQIAAAILERWGETVSQQVLSNFYILRVWPKESGGQREGEIEGERPRSRWRGILRFVGFGG